MKLRLKGNKTGNHILIYESGLNATQRQKIKDMPYFFWITIDTDTIEKRDKEKGGGRR